MVKSRQEIIDLINSIYGGVIMNLDPTKDQELYNKIRDRLSDDLIKLQQALNIK